MGELGPVNEALERRAREAYRAMLATQGPHEVPSEDQIVDLVLGRLSGEERDRVADGIVASPELAADVRDLMAVHAESSAELSPAPAAPRPRWYWVAAAAAVVIVAVGVTPMILRDGPPGSAIRNGEAASKFATVPADGSIVAPPTALTWEPGASFPTDGATYRVVLYDFESTVIWESEDTDGSSVELPPHVREAMRPGEDYYWRVSVRSGLNEERSALLRFQIRP